MTRPPSSLRPGGDFGQARNPDEPKTLFPGETSASDAIRSTAPFVELGTGRLIAHPQATAPADMQIDERGDVSLNFANADIRDLVRLVLADALGVNYIIDPAVTGQVTIRTSSPLPAAETLEILGSLLRLNGAALIKEDNLFKVVPIGKEALSGGPISLRMRRGQGSERSTVQVAPLAYADATQLADLLQPFIGEHGALQIDTVRNTLLLIGEPDQIATINDLITMFDVDWLSGMSFGLYPLSAVAPSQLVDELDQIFADPDSGFTPSALRFVPIDRMNALLVITAQPAYLKRIESWIKRLDQLGDGDGMQVFVYPVQNGQAAELASVLGELFDIRSSAIGGDDLLAPGREPAVIRSASLDDVKDTEDGFLERPNGSSREAARRRPRQSRELTQGGDDATRIVADETTNSLLIRSDASDYRKIRAALRELDTMPLQVLLEATIAEVTLADELSHGVQWFLGSGNSNITLSEVSSGVVGQVFPGFSGLLSRGDVRAVINALDSISDVKVISSPQILVLDNQTANLEVGDQVPIVTQQAESLDSDVSRVINTVEQRQTGVILNVTPRVNSSGMVVLDVEQEVSDVVQTTTSGIDSPTISQRRIGTSVAVGSNQTVALGGLIQDDVVEVRSGIPVMQDLPIIGHLFGSTLSTTRRTELLVLITPKILHNQEETIAATAELRSRLRSVEPLQLKINKKPSSPSADKKEEPPAEAIDHRPEPVALGDSPADQQGDDVEGSSLNVQPAAGPTETPFGSGLFLDPLGMLPDRISGAPASRSSPLAINRIQAPPAPDGTARACSPVFIVMSGCDLSEPHKR